jgi:hypothetical protein
MTHQTDKIVPYATAIVKLLQGPVYDDNERVWNELLFHQIPITEYFEKIGLDVIIDKKDGFGYLKQIELDDEGKTIGLVRRIPLTYEVTLVLVILREFLDEFEVNDTESRNPYITHEQLRARIELFFKDKANKVKLLKELDNYINDVERLGFLKTIKKSDSSKDENQYEIRRIIKAKITNDKLEEFLNKLKAQM